MFQQGLTTANVCTVFSRYQWSGAIARHDSIGVNWWNVGTCC